MNHHPPILTDCFGNRWRVAEARPTAHGWLLHLGRPILVDGSTARQGATAIPTPELRDHLAATVERPSETDLPLSPPAVRRLRRMLGLMWRTYRRQWWQEREAELAVMTEERFAAKHGIAQSTVSMKLRTRGQLRRPLRRLDDPGLAELLHLDISHAELARILEVSPPTVARWRAKLAAQIPDSSEVSS
jgi:hypothetical protein